MASAVIGAAPEVYERHVGRYGRRLAERMIGIAELRAGQRALDVGCGPGALAGALSRVLGPRNVAAIDPSERFVAVCRARTPGADVRVGRAEQLPYPDRTFDAVLAQLVVDGLDDARRGVAEMRRTTRPGGVVVGCVWDYDGGMTLLDTMWRAAIGLDPDLAREHGADRRLPWSRPAELGELWRTSGLYGVRVGSVTVEAAYADLDDLWDPFAAGVGGLGALVRSLEEEDRERLKQDVGRRLGSPDGPFTLTARAWHVRGLAPGAAASDTTT